MSKKKAKKKRPLPNITFDRINEIEVINGAAQRVNSVIQKMTDPPETVMSHLKRIGVTPIIDQMILDEGDPKTYVVIEYEELLKKELQNIAEGSTFKEQYPSNDGPVAKPTVSNTPVVLEEIRKRMDEAVKRHPSSYLKNKQQEEQQLELQLSEDEWPITGENPL